MDKDNKKLIYYIIWMVFLGIIFYIVPKEYYILLIGILVVIVIEGTVISWMRKIKNE